MPCTSCTSAGTAGQSPLDTGPLLQGRILTLRCYPGVAVTILGRPSHRARSGHGQHLQIRSLASDPDDTDGDLRGPGAALQAVEPLGDDRPRPISDHRPAPGISAVELLTFGVEGEDL